MVKANGYSRAQAREHYEKAKKFVVDVQAAGEDIIQKKFKIDYPAAVLIVEWLERDGIIGPERHVKPREIFIQPDRNDQAE